MIHVLLYISTAIVFLALDFVMLKKVMYPLFSANIGPMMLEDLRMGPAAVFYLFYVVGVVWFVSRNHETDSNGRIHPDRNSDQTWTHRSDEQNRTARSR